MEECRLDFERRGREGGWQRWWRGEQEMKKKKKNSSKRRPRPLNPAPSCQEPKPRVLGSQIGEGELSNPVITQTVAREPGLPGTYHLRACWCQELEPSKGQGPLGQPAAQLPRQPALPGALLRDDPCLAGTLSQGERRPPCSPSPSPLAADAWGPVRLHERHCRASVHSSSEA